MEQENLQKNKVLSSQFNDIEIIRMIQATYKSKNTQQIQIAESILNSYLSVDRFIQKLIEMLENQQQINSQNSQQFKTAVAILIKKFSYQFSKKQDMNKQIFIQKLYSLLVSNLYVKSKQQLGTALQYLLNIDKSKICPYLLDSQYRPHVIQKITHILQLLPDKFVLEGCIIISTACLNSLIEAEDQFQFVWKILDPIIYNLSNIIQNLKTLPIQNLVLQENKKIFKLTQRMFDFMQLAFSRFLDQEDLLQENVDLLRKKETLQLLFFNYLANFNHRKSILSTIPQINSVKQLVVEIVFGLYRSKPMPQNLFNLFFITMLLECQKQTYEEQEEHIVTRVLQLLQDYLQNKLYKQTFDDHKMQVLMCMLMYSVTKPDEFDQIQDQPQRFVQTSEQYTEAFKGSVNIKVRAASLLKMFVSKFDQALRNILQIVVIIVTSKMEEDDSNSPCLELYNNLKQQFPQFMFFKIDSSLQLQTCFNILSLVSSFIKRRDDLNKVVYALLVTHFSKLQQIQSPIVVLRLIRMIGYYPTAVFYPYIKSKMSMGRTFVLEGLKSFQRILKLNRYPQIFQVLAEIFQDLVNLINIQDTIFQSIVLNHYERILKKNLKLYSNFMIKIRDTFIQNVEKSQHVSLLCLSYIYSMINKQSQSSFRMQICQYFYAIQEYYTKLVDFYKQKTQTQFSQSNDHDRKILKNLSNYEEKIIDIYSIIIKKQSFITQRMLNFALAQLKNLNTHNRNDEIFRLYNNLFLKIDNDYEGIVLFYNSFINQIRDMFSTLFNNNAQFQKNNQIYSHKLQILPNLSYLISQIFACFYQVHIQKNDLLWMLKVLNFLTEDVKQYLLLIMLSYAYVQPQKFKQLLRQQNLYEQTLKFLLTTNYTEKTIRKVFLLSMTKLLQIEQQYFKDIIKQCIKYFKEQFKQNQTRKQKKQYVDPRLRRMLHDEKEDDEESMMAQIKEEGLSSVGQFKHPWTALSEYDQFKVKVWQNTNELESLSEQDKNQLREILQMDWFGKGVRKIVAVRQDK